MASPTIQFKRGAFVNLPGLQAGEPGFTTDKYDLFVGLTSETSTNKFFGSHRYWGREDGTSSLRLKLVDKDGNNSINFKAPDTLVGIVTYTFPATPTADYFLKTSADGTLSWNEVSLNSFVGIVTFTDTTDNTLGDADTGSVQIDGGLGVNKNVTVGAGLSVAGESYFIGTATFYGGQINLGDSDGDNISVAGEFVSNLVPNATNTYDLGLTGKRWRNGFYSGNVETSGDLNVTGVSTVGTLVLSGTPGIAITAISSSTTLVENSNAFLPTQAAVKSYVDAIDLTLGITADSGGPSTVSTSQTLTISGTANEVNTSVSGQTITVGLPDDVVVGTSLSSPTIKVATVQHSNGTQAATVDSSGNITASQNLTVSGNLYVNGSTTQVNTAALTVEDRTIDLGIVNGAAPSTNTTWDLGVLFNYYSSGAAKKSAVVWEHNDSRFKFASVLASDNDGSDVDTPQLTVTTFAPIEVSELWINNTCTGGSSQVIACSGANLVLQNILIDGGTF